MNTTVHTTLGDLIDSIYEEFLALYGDEDIASVATAATINDMLSRPESAEGRGHPAKEAAGTA